MNVLLVEDDDGVREVMEDLLRDSARVRGVSTVAEALKTLEAEPFELIFADLRIRGQAEGGRQILTAARKRLVPIVVMTGLQRDEVRRNLGTLLPDAVLLKPFAIEEATAIFNRFARLWEQVEALTAADRRSGNWAPLGAGVELLALEGDLQEGRRLLRWGEGGRTGLQLKVAQVGRVVEGEVSVNGEMLGRGRSFFLVGGQAYESCSDRGGLAALVSAAPEVA